MKQLGSYLHFFKTLKGKIHLTGVFQVLLLWFILHSFMFSQVTYNHPEIQWQSFETEHFRIHFYPETERTAREGAAVAESIYPYVTKLYDYEPPQKTHIIFLDTDDFSNGIAYYYDNKIEIWASPMDFELRGSHRWLQNVITHEFVHIISIQKAMKFGQKIPGAYFQWIDYEDEKREDVLYGYPFALVSYPIPGTVVPPWLAEGVSQYMYEGATHDFWDTHRDMILRDRVLHDNLLTFTEMNTFGKSGIGNESTYNAGFALVRYISVKYGEESLKRIMESLSNPFRFSIRPVIKEAIGISADQLYVDFKNAIQKGYDMRLKHVFAHERKGKIIIRDGTTNLHPVWSPDGQKFAYISNSENDFFAQTDLYVYSFKDGKSEKIADGVLSIPAWKSSGDVIYYSKKSKPDRNGSRWYDLYEYNFEEKEENRLTIGARAFSPVILPGDSLLAYIAAKDGTHNVFLINLNRGESERITSFDNGWQLFGLEYDEKSNSLLLDYVENHFRNIAVLNLSDTTFSNFLATAEWDERDISSTPDGGFIYSYDKSGIFNLYYMDPSTGEQGYITNVTGGAFMPDVSKDGRIIYSLYEDGGYKIALLDSIVFVENDMVGYSPDYFRKFANLPGPIISADSSKAGDYEDAFPPMFILPKVMVDYGTIKPGFYFYSSEILNKLNVFGGASFNSVWDFDIFLLFEFRKLYPTLYTEIFYITRNVTESTRYIVYNFDYDLRFQLFQWDAGLKFPILGWHELKLYGSYQKFREDVKERFEGQLGKLGFDYYIGKHSGIGWESDIHKPTVDYNINPGNGFQLKFDLRYENDRFFDKFKINEDYSTLEEVYKTYNFLRFYGKGNAHFTLPFTNRWTTTLEVQSGWMSETEVDSFFNFFGGGLPGIKGYPFYGVEGNRLALTSLSLRIPLMRQKHISLGPFILQNIIIGAIAQYGDTWDGKNGTFNGKRSMGLQLRFGGFSFYNYPTGIAMEVHKGLDKLENENKGKIRTYFTLLFGF